MKTLHLKGIVRSTRGVSCRHLSEYFPIKVVRPEVERSMDLLIDKP